MLTLLIKAAARADRLALADTRVHLNSTRTHEGVTLTGRGGDALARFYQMSLQLLRGSLIGEDVLTAGDFDELYRAYDDPSFWFIGITDFGIWGRQHGGSPTAVSRWSLPNGR